MGKGQLGGAPSWFKKITDKIRRDISNTQGQNLITYPYYESSKTENGIQFSIRSDGSIKVNGHATADTYFKIHREHHNLDRCRTQFKLVEDMEAKWDTMREIIEKYK